MIDRELEIGFLLRRDETIDSHFAAMDIGWAQELFGRRGELSVIQLKLKNPRDRDATIGALRKVLPPDARVASPAQRTVEVEKCLRLELNMTAMSLVSLWSNVTIYIRLRLGRSGIMKWILRSLGVTRNEVRALLWARMLCLGDRCRSRPGRRIAPGAGPGRRGGANDLVVYVF